MGVRYPNFFIPPNIGGERLSDSNPPPLLLLDLEEDLFFDSFGAVMMEIYIAVAVGLYTGVRRECHEAVTR